MYMYIDISIANNIHVTYKWNIILWRVEEIVNLSNHGEWKELLLKYRLSCIL